MRILAWENTHAKAKNTILVRCTLELNFLDGMNENARVTSQRNNYC